MPVIALEPERNIQRLTQPFLRHVIGPTESDRGQHARAVVQRKAQVVGPHASRPNRAHVTHAKDRRGISGPTRLEMANQSLQVGAQDRER